MEYIAPAAVADTSALEAAGIDPAKKFARRRPIVFWVVSTTVVTALFVALIVMIPH